MAKNYRKRAIKTFDHKCVVCSDARVVQVHHINENRKDNRIFNLCPLCPTCHALFHNGVASVREKVMEFRELAHEKWLMMA